MADIAQGTQTTWIWTSIPLQVNDYSLNIEHDWNFPSIGHAGYSSHFLYRGTGGGEEGPAIVFGVLVSQL